MVTELEDDVLLVELLEPLEPRVLELVLLVWPKPLLPVELLVFDVEVVWEGTVVVGKFVGMEKPLGKENEFAGVVIGRPVGIVTLLGREKEFPGLPITIDKPWG